MRLNPEIPWERYALIAELAKRFEAHGRALGKTALQKMIFLFQRLFGVDCDYTYTLYTYGPYCADLARDLEIVAGLGGAQITYNWGYGRFEIRPGPAGDELRRRGAGFLAQIAGALDRLIADYGLSTAKELELRSTIVYLGRPTRTIEELVRLVHQVKPYFSENQIEAACRELAEKRYLAPAVAAARSLTAAN